MSVTAASLVKPVKPVGSNSRCQTDSHAQPPPHAELRAREYLTAAEVERLMTAARGGRYGHRDATLILVGYRHGLRASEIGNLEWSQVELGRNATLHVRRAKSGKPGAHPLRGDEVRALRELRRQFPDSAFVFATERGGPFTPDAISRHLKRIDERAREPASQGRPGGAVSQAPPCSLALVAIPDAIALS